MLKLKSAAGETRTRTGLLPQDPEPCVSTNFTTAAALRNLAQAFKKSSD